MKKGFQIATLNFSREPGNPADGKQNAPDRRCDQPEDNVETHNDPQLDGVDSQSRPPAASIGATMYEGRGRFNGNADDNEYDIDQNEDHEGEVLTLEIASIIIWESDRPLRSMRTARRDRREHDHGGFQAGCQKHLGDVLQFDAVKTNSSDERCINRGHARRFRRGKGPPRTPPMMITGMKRAAPSSRQRASLCTLLFDGPGICASWLRMPCRPSCPAEGRGSHRREERSDRDICV